MLEVAKHKVHEIGGSLMITLPKIWRERNNVKKGCAVGVYFGRKDELIIRPAEEGQ